MKAKISLVALALAGALPLAALADQPMSKSGTDSYYGAQSAAPATPATPASPSGSGSAATPATPASPATAATPAEPQGGAKSAEAEFRQLDKNHDGKLTKDEAKADPEVAKNFAAMDTNHDGKISLAEFKKAEEHAKL